MSKRYPAGILRKTPQTPSQTSAQGVWNMTDVTQAQKSNTWPIAGVPDPMSRSLRFRSSASAYLSRTFTVAGNSYKFTQSFWCKRGSLGSYQAIGYGTTSPGTVYSAVLRFSTSDTLDWYCYYNGSSWTGQLSTTQVFRDPSAWYHIVISADTTQATSSERLKMYVNGVQVTALSTASYPPQNTVLVYNGIGNANYQISAQNTNSFFDGYITELNYIDGQALTPSSFGGTDQYGVWQARPYTGTYGTNGFYLKFSDTTSTTTLCYDYSGNSNNWTPNNISLTSGTTYDSMVDVPTQWIPYNTAGDTGALYRGNYATWNPLLFYSTTVPTLTNGNLTGTWNNTNMFCGSTIALPNGQKTYAEFTLTVAGSTRIGIKAASDPSQYSGGWTYIASSGNIRNTSDTTVQTVATAANGDIISVAVDLSANSLQFYKNGSAIGTALTIANGNDWVYWLGQNGSATPQQVDANFGQQPFVYTPPSGYKTLNTVNLPASTIQQGNLYMDATLYTGNGSTQSIINSGGFKPDFVWTKARANAYSPNLYDSVRGVNQNLQSNTTGAEFFNAGSLTSFNSNGFTVGANDNGNASSSSVGWQWQAGQGTTSSNTSGSITSTVSANPTAGFSIVTFTGTGAAGTVGHGLGVTPSMFIVKSRSATGDWWVYHAYANASPQTGTLWLNLTNGFTSPASYWNNTAPTSSVFSIGTAGGLNVNGVTQVAYCWAAVSGFSAFGSYTGNGSTDGTFVYTGFRPKFVMFKASSTTSSWAMVDSSRDTYNLAGQGLQANSSAAELTPASSGYPVDFLSNGFKLRVTGDPNSSSVTYIYAAFAENPFKNALAR